MSVIAVFGDSVASTDSKDYKTALKIGELFAKNGYDIATGGYGGVMEAALKGAYDHNVQTIGVMFLDETERKRNKYVRNVVEVKTYLDRLQHLIYIADAFLVLPGGTGTLLELTAIWALKERNLLGNKPIVCIGEQWQEVIETMEFYSEKIMEATHFISHTDSLDEALGIVNGSIK